MSDDSSGRRCNKCLEFKPASQFSRQRYANGWALKSWCRACRAKFEAGTNLTIRLPAEVMEALDEHKRRTGEKKSRAARCAIVAYLTAGGAPAADGKATGTGTAGLLHGGPGHLPPGAVTTGAIGEDMSALVTSLSRVRAGTGRLWRALNTVDAVYVDDLARCERVGMVVGPRHIEKVTRFLGGRPEMLPAPGTTDDYLAAEAPE